MRGGAIENALIVASCAVAVGALQGCGDSSNLMSADAERGTSDAGSASSFAVTIDTTGLASLVAYREGVDGPWRTPDRVTPTQFRFSTSSIYSVIVVCPNDPVSSGVSTLRWAQAPGDPTEIDAHCLTSGPTSTATVTGTVRQAGVFAIGNAGGGTYQVASSTADWQIEGSSPLGLVDALAYDNTGVEIRRNLTISRDTALDPAFDIDSRGTPLQPVTVAVANVTPGESLASRTTLVTSNGVYGSLYKGDGTRFSLLPDDVLIAGDHQNASVRAADGFYSRAIGQYDARVGDHFDLSLPPALAPVSIEVSGDTLLFGLAGIPTQFTVLEAYTNQVDDDAGLYLYSSIQVSPGFVETAGVTSIALDVSAAGFMESWKQDFAKPYSRSIGYVRVLSDHSEGAAYDEEQADSAALAPRLRVARPRHDLDVWPM